MKEDTATEDSLDAGAADPVAAYRAFAAVLLEIEQALGPDALRARPPEPPPAAPVAIDDPVPAVPAVPAVPFAVSIVPDRDPEPLEPVDPAAAEAAGLASEDLVPRLRWHRMRAPTFGHRP